MNTWHALRELVWYTSELARKGISFKLHNTRSRLELGAVAFDGQKYLLLLIWLIPAESTNKQFAGHVRAFKRCYDLGDEGMPRIDPDAAGVVIKDTLAEVLAKLADEHEDENSLF